MSLPPPPPGGAFTPQYSASAPTCRRHANRPAGRNCTRCGQPACADCLTTAAVGSLCPDCVAASPRPKVARIARGGAAAFPMTIGLISINVALFVISVLQQPSSLMNGDNPLNRVLDLWEPSVAAGDWYQLVTSGFMHFGLLHIGLNMFMLFQLGRLLEPTAGSIRFGLLYIASLLGGSLGVILLTSAEQTAGASGAIFGLLGAAAVGQWLRGINPFATSLGTLIIINVIFTFAVPFISVGGHLGGLAMGALCGFAVMRPRQRGTQSSNAVLGYAVPIALGLIAFGASVVLAQPL